MNIQKILIKIKDNLKLVLSTFVITLLLLLKLSSKNKEKLLETLNIFKLKLKGNQENIKDIEVNVQDIKNRVSEIKEDSENILQNKKNRGEIANKYFPDL